MKIIKIDRTWAGYPICATVTLLKEDIHVLLTGGSLPHTGAVSMFCNGKEDGQLQPSGHKDRAVSERWGKLLSETFQCRVTAVCGIHYDDLERKQIAEIVALTDEMLTEAIREINRWYLT